MRIVFDARVHLNYFSGISRYIICLLDTYLKRFPQDEMVVLLNPEIQKDNSIYTILGKYSNVRFEVVRAGHMGPKNYLLMGRIIKKLAPDVYHYPHLDAPIFTGKIPVVATVHDSNSNKEIKKFDDKFGLKSVYFKKALGATLKHADKVIFVSDSIKNEILKDYNIPEINSKYTRIYNGFESDFNSISNEEISAELKTLNCQKPYLLFVGQIREHKNIFRVIDAFKQFQQKHSEFNLVIVGHNYLKLDLAEPHIQHFDKVSNTTLKALYAGCTSFIFPSLFEGFGFPILEAFSFGKPVVTSNYGATREISSPHSILVNPKSVEDICNGIEASIKLDDLTQSRIQHALSYSWDQNVEALRLIYLELANSED